MTISFPPRIEAALERAAGEFGQSVPDYLKSVCFAAATSEAGFCLRLQLPPVVPDPEQLSLPLGGGARRRARSWLPITGLWLN